MSPQWIYLKREEKINILLKKTGDIKLLWTHYIHKETGKRLSDNVS